MLRHLLSITRKNRYAMKFIKIFLAALLAVVVGGILTFLFWVLLLTGLVGSLSSVTKIEKNSILKIDLSEDITDAPSVDPLASFDYRNFEIIPSLSLYKALQAIDAAAADDRIRGIYLQPGGGGAVSLAALEELREAIENFKHSGKFVVAYDAFYSQYGYYLASAADKVYLQPEGEIEWKGISYQLPFYKGLFDKLGIEFEIFRPTACKYKSAVEPYFLTRMSEANREQVGDMVASMWETVAGTVARSRGFENLEAFNALTDKLQLSLAEDALAHGMVDALLYEDQMDDIFAELGMGDDPDDYRFVTLGEYASQVVDSVDNLSDPQIAVIYADGTILDGAGQQAGVIFGNSLAARIDDVRKDDNVAAVVLRVNSPGGSALASDIVWREMTLLQARKPVIVSMGAYAASGGYYISCPADAIVADRLTLTGSIGVYGAIPVTGDFFRKKLGITFDGVSSNKSADMGQGFLLGSIRPTTDTERRLLMRSVDKIYENFTGKVALGRNLPLEKVLDIAGGRVWSGADALHVGLVDGCGGLKTAIAVAADKAGLEAYRVEERLDEPTGLSALFSGMQAKWQSRFERNDLGAAFEPYKKAREILSQSGVLMYCPYTAE